MSFGVAAMNEQFGIAATLASSAVAAYMVGSAGGMLLGGFVASRASRPDFVAAAGVVISACGMLSVAAGALPGAGRDGAGVRLRVFGARRPGVRDARVLWPADGSQPAARRSRR